jgi:predicted tellurium resistance membrane protein TerC
MNKQKQVIELLIYLVVLIIGIILLINGYHKKDFEVVPDTTTEYIYETRGQW